MKQNTANSIIKLRYESCSEIGKMQIRTGHHASNPTAELTRNYGTDPAQCYKMKNEKWMRLTVGIEKLGFRVLNCEFALLK